MDLGYTSMPNQKVMPEQGYNQQQQQQHQQGAQIYQNQPKQQYQSHQGTSSSANRRVQNQPMNNNQYDNQTQEQPQIEEESYDSSNINNYTAADQFKQQQHNQYQQQSQNQGDLYKNANKPNPNSQKSYQNHNYYKEDQGDNYFEMSQNPSSQFYQSMPSNQQAHHQEQDQQENQIYNNEMYGGGVGGGKHQGSSYEPDDSLASDINENQPFDGFEDLFNRIQKDFKDNKINEALDVCEKTIFNQQRVKGQASFMKLFEQILKFLNNEAVNSLNQNQYEKSLFILIKCKELTELSILKNPPSLRALTFNNFGCYYRRLQQLPKALGYLEQALRFLNQIKSRDYLGMTYLNISAVLSQMNEHYASLENSKKAVVEMHKDYQNYLTRKSYEEAFKEQEFIDICQALAIAFYNVGVEQEYFQNYEVSLVNYGKACEVSEDNLGPNHKLTRRFKELFAKFNEGDKQQNQVPRGHRKLVSRPNSGLQKALNKNKSWQSQSSYSNEHGSDKEMSSKINPYRQSYGVKASDFTQHGKNIFYKNTNAPSSQPMSRLPSAKKTPALKINRPNSSKNFYPEVKSNIISLNRPLSAKFQNHPQGGFFNNQLTPKLNSQGLSRPFSAQINKNNQIVLNQNKQTVQQNPALRRPQNKAKQQTKDMVIEGEEGNQNIYDWVDSPTNSSDSAAPSKKVIGNQLEFLKNIKNDAEIQIQKLQQEEKDLIQRIQKLKDMEEADLKQRQQKQEEQKKIEEEEASRIKLNQQKEEEEERKRLIELSNLKKREEEELEKIKQIRNKDLEKERDRQNRLKELKKKDEEEIEKLKQVRAKQEQEQQKKIHELEMQKIEEENKLKEFKEKAVEEIKRIQQQSKEEQNKLKQVQNLKQEDQSSEREKEEMRKKLEEERVEKEKLLKEQKRFKEAEREKERIEKENQLLKHEKDKLLEEIQRLQNNVQANKISETQKQHAEQQQIQTDQKFIPSFKCVVQKNYNDNYDYGIQTDKHNYVIVHAIPHLVNEKYPHFQRYIDISTISDGHLKDCIIKSLIKLIQGSISINLEKNSIKFHKSWKETERMIVEGKEVDIAIFDCKVHKVSKNNYTLKIEDRENLQVITSVVHLSLDQTLKKVLDEVSPRTSQIIQPDSIIQDKSGDVPKVQVEEQGIPEDEQTVEKVLFIQGAFRGKKAQEKAKQEIKRAVEEQKQTLLSRVILFGKYKLFLQCFKQIVPEGYIVQVDSLNPKQLQLPKISDKQNVQKILIDRMIASDNPFTDNLILLNEKEGKISFQVEKSISSPQKGSAEEERENYYEEEDLASNHQSSDQAKKSKKQNEDNYDYSFDSISDGEGQKKNKISEREQKDMSKNNKKNPEQDDIEYDEEQKLAALVIQNAVLSKKQKQKQKKEKIILVQVFVTRFDQKFIFQLYRKVEQKKIKDQVSFENLMKKPSRWFAKLNIPAILSQEIIIKSKERGFSPLDYFDLIHEEQQIVLTELSRNFAASFIKKMYDTYYKEVFFQVEKSQNEKYLFCLQKLVRKGKEGESVHRIRTESMKDKNLSSFTPIDPITANNMIQSKSSNKLSILSQVNYLILFFHFNLNFQYIQTLQNPQKIVIYKIVYKKIIILKIQNQNN